MLPGMIRVRNAIHRGQNEYADKNRIQKKTEYRKRQNTEKDRIQKKTESHVHC